MTAFYNTIKKYTQISLLTIIVSLYISTINEQEGLFADTPPGEEIFDIKFSNGQLTAKLKKLTVGKGLKRNHGAERGENMA